MLINDRRINLNDIYCQTHSAVHIGYIHTQPCNNTATYNTIIIIITTTTTTTTTTIIIIIIIIIF